jgi:hypothetical protein
MFFNNVFVIVSLYFGAKVCKKTGFSGSCMYFFTSSCYLHSLQIKDLMNSLLIFSEKNSPRLNYICRLIFNRHLGLDWTVTTDKQAFETYEGAKIGYSAIPSDAPLRIHPVSLLFETGVQVQHIETGIFNGVTVPFKTAGGALPFDLLAAVFYLVSRYEEYLPFEPNQYGQFKAADSLAYKLGFLNKPVVDTWITALKDALQKQFPFLRFRQKRFATTFTYDIDVAYAYKGRSIFTNAGAAIKDLLSLHFKDIAQRFSVLNGSMKDPFDTYDAILEQQKNCGHNLLFFFLLGPKNKYNRNLHPYKKELQQLVRRITAAANTGIHPSYFANDDYLQLQHEKLLLETIAQKKITCSRQHYLRLVFPHTYLHLMKAGITDDYTLGFAEMPGFRAGTCSAFPFYNLLTEEETALLLHPNTFMEGTFMEDMQLKPDAALPLMKQLAEEVKNVNGHFISIWHNHSLSNKKQWAGLKEVHDSLADFAAAYKNP